MELLVITPTTAANINSGGKSWSNFGNFLLNLFMKNDYLFS
jgi:hypothetical protein